MKCWKCKEEIGEGEDSGMVLTSYPPQYQHADCSDTKSYWKKEAKRLFIEKKEGQTIMEYEQFDIESLRPADTPEYMTPMWLGSISWAIGDSETVEAFRKETGLQWNPAKTGIERMIDKATGADFEFIKAFVLWANINIWGPLDDK